MTHQVYVRFPSSPARSWHHEFQNMHLGHNHARFSLDFQPDWMRHCSFEHDWGQAKSIRHQQ